MPVIPGRAVVPAPLPSKLVVPADWARWGIARFTHEAMQGHSVAPITASVPKLGDFRTATTMDAAILQAADESRAIAQSGSGGPAFAVLKINDEGFAWGPLWGQVNHADERGSSHSFSAWQKLRLDGVTASGLYGSEKHMHALTGIERINSRLQAVVSTDGIASF